MPSEKVTLELSRRSFNRMLGAFGLSAGLTPTVFGARKTNAATQELKGAYGALGPERHAFSVSINPDDDVANLIWDKLLRFSDKMEIIPHLAENYEQLDPRRLNVRIPAGITFHDGRPLTSQDIKYSLEYGGSGGTIVAYLYEYIDHVEIVDEQAVQIVYKNPSRVAVANMAYHSHVIPSMPAGEDPRQTMIGSGPYKFLDYIPNNRVILEANENYWGPRKPAFNRITFRIIPEDATRMAALRAGEIDFGSNVPIEVADTLEQNGLNVISTPSLRVMFVRFNLAVEGPWQDVRVRQALNHAVDREAINKAFLGGLGAPMTGCMARVSRYFHSPSPQYTFDPEKARNMLREAGFGDGFEVTMAVPNGRYQKDREIGEAVAGQLEAVGVRVTLAPLEWANYLQQVRAEKETTGKQYGISLFAWGNQTGDADFALLPFDTVNDTWNLGSYNNPELQELIERGRVTIDETVLGDIYRTAQDIVWRDAPWLFLFELPVVHGHSKAIQNVIARPDEQMFWPDVRPA